MPMHQDINPKAPENDRGRVREKPRIYFELFCRRAAQGRHRQAPRILPSTKGMEYLRVFIKFSSAGGMPNWGTSGVLNDDEVDHRWRVTSSRPPRTAQSTA